MMRLRIKRRLFLLAIGTLIFCNCFSQEDTSGAQKSIPSHALAPAPAPSEEIFYKGSLEGGGGIIYPITNKALCKSLAGVYYLHFSANYVFAPHLFVGLEFEDSQFGNTSSVAAYNTLMYIYSGGGKFGYYTYMQHDFLFCYSIAFGPSLIKYVGAPDPAPKGGFIQSSFFMTPNVLASYRINDQLRIGLEASVVLTGYRFDPAYTGISQYIVYDPTKDINAVTTYIEWGFGVYWAFSEPKK
jgi:hypothetical protein